VLQHEDAMPFNDYVRSNLRNAKCSSTYVRALDTLASGYLCSNRLSKFFAEKLSLRYI
jgi:hypothetical protein